MVDFLRKKYNYIIIDTTPYLSEIIQASLVEADAIVLLTSQDIPSVKSSSMFLNLADATGIERMTAVTHARFKNRPLVDALSRAHEIRSARSTPQPSSKPQRAPYRARG